MTYSGNSLTLKLRGKNPKLVFSAYCPILAYLFPQSWKKTFHVTDLKINVHVSLLPRATEGNEVGHRVLL